MAHLGLASHDLHGSILLRDSLDLQASFLLAQLIKTALEGGADAAAHVGPAAAPAARCRRRVVLLAAQQAASHYAQVLRKAGLQVPALLASGQLTVLDLLPSLGSGLPPLHALHRQLAAAVASGGGGGDGGGGHACLVADDLSVSWLSVAVCDLLGASAPPSTPSLRWRLPGVCCLGPVQPPLLHPHSPASVGPPLPSAEPTGLGCLPARLHSAGPGAVSGSQARGPLPAAASRCWRSNLCSAAAGCLPPAVQPRPLPTHTPLAGPRMLLHWASARRRGGRRGVAGTAGARSHGEEAPLRCRS